MQIRIAGDDRPSKRSLAKLLSSLRRRWNQIRLLMLCGLWLCAVGLGFGALLRYSNTPALEHAAPPIWPTASSIARDPLRPTLLMFAHPRCACTQASLGELARLMVSSQGRVAAHVLFYRPSAAAKDWAQGALLDTAAAIPGVTVHEDEDGRQAQLFLSNASGHTVLYSVKGELLFDGGMTASRGHSGDNVGRDALSGLIYGGRAAPIRTSVFGCLIHSEKTPIAF